MVVVVVGGGHWLVDSRDWAGGTECQEAPRKNSAGERTWGEGPEDIANLGCACWMTLANSLSLSAPQFSHPFNGAFTGPRFTECEKTVVDTLWKLSSDSPSPSRGLSVYRGCPCPCLTESTKSKNKHSQESLMLLAPELGRPRWG